MHYKYLQRNCSVGINTHLVAKTTSEKHISQDNILFFLFVLFVCFFVQLLGCFYQSIFYSTYLRCDRWRRSSLSSSRANPSSRSAGSCTSPRRPQTKDRLLPLPHLKTCASKHPSPTRLSPPPRPSSTRMGEVTPTTGLTPGWAPPRSPRAASPATRCPARSSPAGTCLHCSGQRALSSPLSSWASNQGRMDRPSLEPLAPGFPISMTSRRRRCNPLLLRPPTPPPPSRTTDSSLSWKYLPDTDITIPSSKFTWKSISLDQRRHPCWGPCKGTPVTGLVTHSNQDSKRRGVSAVSTVSDCLSAYKVRKSTSLPSKETRPMWPLCCHLVATELYSKQHIRQPLTDQRPIKKSFSCSDIW